LQKLGKRSFLKALAAIVPGVALLSRAKPAAAVPALADVHRIDVPADVELDGTELIQFRLSEPCAAYNVPVELDMNGVTYNANDCAFTLSPPRDISATPDRWPIERKTRDELAEMYGDPLLFNVDVRGEPAKWHGVELLQFLVREPHMSNQQSYERMAKNFGEPTAWAWCRDLPDVTRILPGPENAPERDV